MRLLSWQRVPENVYEGGLSVVLAFRWDVSTPEFGLLLSTAVSASHL